MNITLRRASSKLFLVFLFHILMIDLAAGRDFIDMAGHRITLPGQVRRILTAGPVPVLNGFVFLFGKQDALVNGLPINLRRNHQLYFAPGLVTKPVVQGAGQGIALEDIASLKPDLILTMDAVTTETLQELGMPVLFLKWTDPEDVKAVITLLGNIFGDPKAASAYVDYFNRTLARIEAATAPAKAENRPRVLYVNLKGLTQPHRIAEWWIAKAGGRSLTDDGRQMESTTFSLEQMQSWNPEVMIVADQTELAHAYSDPRFQNLAAVRNKRVYVAPAGAHLWANRTVEQPLTLLWALTVIHPELFQETNSLYNLEDEVDSFYENFFHVRLSKEQINAILAGSDGR